MSEGKNSAIAAVLDTESGRVFVKGLRVDYPRRWTQDAEALINPVVAEISPRLLFRHVGAEWDLLGFQAVDGRHASYEPGSPDLPLLVETMATLGAIGCPDLPVKQAPQRWANYVSDPAHVHLFGGDVLLHTDYAPDNVLIAGGRALLIDWAWPTRGASWIDPACLVLRLMAGGHTAAQAEQVVSALPAWTAAPREAVTAFAEASANLWSEIAGGDGSAWTKRMDLAAQEWASYRAR